MPGSQQPNSMFGFGQNIVDKKICQVFPYADFLLGPKKNFTDVAFGALYGIRDDLSILAVVPFAAPYMSDCRSSAGPQDIILQMEYAIYARQTKTLIDQFTIVGALYLPVGSSHKNPPTGFGSPSFFLGLTASHLGFDWYCFASPGALITTRHGCDNKAGNTFLYQAGFGKNIAYSPNGWILMWILEADGVAIQKSKRNGVFDENSGSNTIYFGPTIWFSTRRFILQAGAEPVIYQRRSGNQKRDSIFIEVVLAWTFN